ncbi:hypothetical protein PG997_010005 [Apiospora hydei]|uniref:Uncharacterized protein n=1 Tax=Apiospora hydei TaxID=1337664 RepID=A0ABR1VVX0_9PEZI
MGSQSNNTSTSTSSKKRKAEKVQTTQNDDQSQDPDVPDFVRRGSYPGNVPSGPHCFRRREVEEEKEEVKHPTTATTRLEVSEMVTWRINTDQTEYIYLQASDVRRQVQQAPSAQRSVGKYPGNYNNNPPLPLSSKTPRREFPINPSPAPGETPRNYQGGQPGPIRAFYNDQDRTKFDVGYKDASKPPRGPRNGSAHPNLNYSLATYHPAPTVTDTSKAKKAKK